MNMSNPHRHQIVQEIDRLPEESLAELIGFIGYLRYKSTRSHPEESLQIVIPGGRDVRVMATKLYTNSADNEIKSRLLCSSGKPLTTSAVARQLSVSLEQVENLRHSGFLIGIPAEEYGYLYPACQFQEDGSIIPDLDKLLRSLARFDIWMQLQFLQTGDLHLDGATPIDSLKQGKLEQALFAATNYGEMRAA